MTAAHHLIGRADLALIPLTPHLENLDIFLSHCHRRHYPAKTTILYVGHVDNALRYIIDGSATMILEDEGEDRELMLEYLNPGDFIGELGLFEQRPCSTWVRAKTACDVAEIAYEKFSQLSIQHPNFLLALNRQITRRLRDTTRKLRNLAFLDVSGRVRQALLDLCHQPSAMTHPKGIQIKITRQEIGLIVGCSREMVGRVLKQLEKDSQMSSMGKTMVIFDATLKMASGQST